MNVCALIITLPGGIGSLDIHFATGVAALPGGLVLKRKVNLITAVVALPGSIIYQKFLIVVRIIAIWCFYLVRNDFAQLALTGAAIVCNCSRASRYGSGCQALSNLHRAVKVGFTCGVGCVVQLVSQCVQHLAHCFLRRSINTVTIRAQGNFRAAIRSLYGKVTAQNTGRIAAIMTVDNHCAAAVAVNGYILAVALLEDDTLVAAAAAGQPGDMAGTIAADILIILAVARVVSLVYPGSAILQPHIHSAAVVNNTTQIRIPVGQGYVNCTCAQGKNVAAKLNCITADNVAILTGVDVNRSLVGAQGIIAIAHTLRYVNFTAADGYSTARSIGCDAVAVYVHIRSTADIHATVFYLRQNTGVIKARQHVFFIQGNAPGLAVRTLDGQVAINCNAIFYVGGIACLTPTISLLYSYAVAAVSAYHTDVNVTIDSNLAGTVLTCVIHNGVVQGIAASSTRSNNIQRAGINSHVPAITGINAHRCGNNALRLQLQRIAACIDGNIVTIMRVNSCKNIISQICLCLPAYGIKVDGFISVKDIGAVIAADAAIGSTVIASTGNMLKVIALLAVGVKIYYLGRGHRRRSQSLLT